MTHKFTHEDKEYEIRSGRFEDSYQAAVFQNGKKLCQNVRISFEDDIEMKNHTGESMLNAVIKALEDEVRNGNIHV